MVTVKAHVWGPLHKTFTREKLGLFSPEFFSYGKVNGKNHVNLSFQILPEILSGRSFMQWAPGRCFIKIVIVSMSIL